MDTVVEKYYFGMESARYSSEFTYEQKIALTVVLIYGKDSLPIFQSAEQKKMRNTV